MIPTVEEILQAWARNPAGLVSAGEKVDAYFDEIERRASAEGLAGDVKLLQTFRQTWTTIASEQR